jgi:TPR repeat protein
LSRLRGVLALACVLSCGCASRIQRPYVAGHSAEGDQAGCDAGNTKACMRLAAAYDSGLGVAADDEKTQALFDRACRLGDYEGCVSLGVQLEARELSIPDGPKRAVELYQSACDHDLASGCLFLGYAYAGSSGHSAVATDNARAHTFFERACQLKGASGCVHAGSDYLEGRRGFQKDPGRAVELYQRACDLGDGEACYTLGNCLLQGQNGVPKDEGRGQALIDRACKIIGAHEPCVTF